MAGAVTVDDFYAGVITCNGTTVRYRLFSPDTAGSPGRAFPIVLALHGVGERGEDNYLQLGNKVINWADETRQAANPSFVLAPQCPSNAYWALDGWGTWDQGVYTISPTINAPLATVMHLLDSLVGVLPVDTNRQYLTGLSMGGMGAYDLMVRYPRRWAAAVPVCGAVDTTLVDNLVPMPIWAFHGAADGIVPPLGTRTTMRHIESLGQTVVYPSCGVEVTGCTPLTTQQEAEAAQTARYLYTEIPDGGHFAWDYAYVDDAMFTWVFLQAKDSDPVTARDFVRRASTYTPRQQSAGSAVDLCGRMVRGAATGNSLQTPVWRISLR